MFQAMQGDVSQQRTDYFTNNVAKTLLEFSISVPRARLRPNYGEGFRGVPLKITRAKKSTPQLNRASDTDAPTSKQQNSQDDQADL